MRKVAFVYWLFLFGVANAQIPSKFPYGGWHPDDIRRREQTAGEFFDAFKTTASTRLFQQAFPGALLALSGTATNTLNKGIAGKSIGALVAIAGVGTIGDAISVEAVGKHLWEFKRHGRAEAQKASSNLLADARLMAESPALFPSLVIADLERGLDFPFGCTHEQNLRQLASLAKASARFAKGFGKAFGNLDELRSVADEAMADSGFPSTDANSKLATILVFIFNQANYGELELPT